MPEATTLISTFSAAMQAIRTWLAVRDRRRTRDTATKAYQRTRRAKLSTTQGRRLARVVPEEVLTKMEARVQLCWERYLAVIDPGNERLPAEIDAATASLQRCLCEELQRIRALNGSVPSGKLRTWWEQYCEKP